MRKLILFFAFALFISFASAQIVTENFNGNSNRGTASYVSYGSSFSSYYGANVNTYWPILSNRDACTASQDIIVQVSPVGCQPAVVRSDLLAEQNVPVFCQLDLLQINPAIDIKQIRNIRFNGRYPEYVAGVGFHPANAALRTTNQLLGTPLQSNIGYVVVVLKRNPDEKKMPKFFNFTLSASVDYYSGSAVGIGASELLVRETNDKDWEVEKNKQSFLRGRFSVKLKDIDSNSAKIELYSGDYKYSEMTLQKGREQPNAVYLPGSYCQTQLQFNYDDIPAPSKIAKIQVDDDYFDVYEGSRFLNNKCAVSRINGDAIRGEVLLNCGKGNENLTSGTKLFANGSEVNLLDEDTLKPGTDKYVIEGSPVKDKDGIVKYKLKGADGKVIDTDARLVRPVSETELFDKAYGDLDSYIINATKLYEEIADSYGAEREDAIAETYGEKALYSAIRLNIKWGRYNTAVRLINKYVQIYPNGNNTREILDDLNRLYSRDISSSSVVVETEDGSHVIKLIEVYEVTKRSSAKIAWGNVEQIVEEGKTVDFRGIGSVAITSIKDADGASVSVKCDNVVNRNGRVSVEVSKDSKTYDLKVRDSKDAICGNVMRISGIDLQRYAKIRITPVTRSSTVGNFTVGIGIEQRAIELTPEKAAKRIENLNKSIKRWESISGNLGEVVKGLKGACLATAGVLTVKNFFSGLSGEAMARRDAMTGNNGWTKICQEKVASKEYASLTACYNAKSSEIAKDVAARTKAIGQSNALTSEIEKRNRYTNKEGPFAGDSFNDVGAKKELIDIIKKDKDCSGVAIGDTRVGQNKKVGDLFPQTVNDENVKSYSYTQLRDIYFNCKVLNNGGSSVGNAKAGKDIDAVAYSVSERLKYEESAKKYQDVEVSVVRSPNSIAQGNYFNYKVSDLTTKGYTFGNNNVPANTELAQVVIGSDNNHYLVMLEQKGDNFVIKNDEIYSLGGNGGKVATKITDSIQFNTLKGQLPNTFRKVDSTSYNNAFATGESDIRYFETEPYKGMPAVVPFDLNKGFYAAASQGLPILGGAKSYESNGRPASFYVCNVMKDGRIGFYAPDYGDDECVQFNIYTGQSFDNFPGLSESDTKRLVSTAVKALEDAARNYGSKQVNINGNKLNVGRAAALTPGAQCQDFMSPEECKLLFNVCDPVICPSSRCNFGGEYYVSDVVASGIVGSALLCLPNYKEEIVVPLCLTGIKAGIDGYVSILKSHRQCLQEAIDTGKYVGICDQVSSVYMCEFFWRQAAPLAKVAIPKLIEFATTGGQKNTRGGGEYMTVQSSWQNAQDSASFFTQSYANNAFDAFRVRSVEEAGTDVCRAFLSVKGPKTFESLVEPDSPAQFHAWFSSIDYTDATFPATSQYKVFYHIFAGNDRGVSYSVYLKDPPSESQYATNPIVVVATGFAARGQYATESKDFTAPKGYKQLCVRINDKDECGFKQVSSSFAVNYVRDKIVSDDVAQKDIATEEECVSGGVSPSALLNPNLQSIGEEAFNPAIYNRGIVRVCATDNPASATEPARFVQVGICGTPRMKCWLDKKSVDNAITDVNIGVKKDTLKGLEEIQKETIEKDKKYSSSGDVDNKIRDLKINDVDSISKFDTALKQIDEIYLKAFWNRDKAKILVAKANVFEKAFEKFLAERNKGNGNKGSESSGSTKTTPASQTPPPSVAEKRTLSFGPQGYLEGSRSYIYVNDDRIDIYLLNDFVFASSQRAGIVDDEDRIIFQNERQKEMIDELFGFSAYDYFNEEEIRVNQLIEGFDLNQLS